MNFPGILNCLDEGIMIIDANGKIVYSNKAYCDFIDESFEQIKGRTLTDIRPGAQAPKVLKTGQPIQSHLRKEKEDEYFVNIYPIKENGRIVGSISVVTFLKNAICITDVMKELEKKEARLSKVMRVTNGTRYSFDHIIARSDQSLIVKSLAVRVADSEVTVLLEGESGCGKELYAQSIHNESERRKAPFVAINCAALSSSVLESELFGYEEGSFTGARKGGKPGLFEIAQGGTLFLDEISELDYSLQSKLLRALQEKKIRRVGAAKETAVDVRIICACNVNLLSYVEDKRFRKDLYYRIAVMPIHIPPLRERKEDIMPLAESILNDIIIQKKKNYRIGTEVEQLFLSYNWPGNVRELRNIMEYACLMSQEEELRGKHLPANLQAADSGLPDKESDEYESLASRTRRYEKRIIEDTLNRCGHDLKGKKEAARQLGISLASLYNKMKQF